MQGSLGRHRGTYLPTTFATPALGEAQTGTGFLFLRSREFLGWKGSVFQCLSNKELVRGSTSFPPIPYLLQVSRTDSLEQIPINHRWTNVPAQVVYPKWVSGLSRCAQLCAWEAKLWIKWDVSFYQETELRPTSPSKAAQEADSSHLPILPSLASRHRVTKNLLLPCSHCRW